MNSPLIIYSVGVCLVILVGILSFALNKYATRYQKLLLAFSGSYVFTVCFTHLLPEAFQADAIRTGYFVIGGFLFN